MKTGRKYFILTMTILWILLIFSFSLQPGEASGDLSSGFGRWLLQHLLPGLLEKIEIWPVEQIELWHTVLRKGAHFTEYFVLGIWMLLSARAFRGKKRSVLWLAWVACILVASADETIQLFVEGRAGRVVDVLLDSAGAFCGLCACGMICRKVIVCKNR